MSTQAAYEINGALVTQAYFYAVACDPRRSVAVEACAGSGKTWMLVSRMVRALLEGCAPQDILAITFTKKAAGEMRQRLQQWLAEFARADDDTLREALRVRGLTQTASDAQLQTLRGLHAALLRQGRPVQIRTFHSWFAALLRTAPMAVLHGLGLPAQYELLESDDQAVAQVWRRFQTRVAGDAPARADYMAAVATYGRHQAHKALEAALSKRVEFGLADAHGVVDTSIDHFAQQFPEFGTLAHPLEHLQTPAVQQLLQDAAHTLGASPLVTCTSAASVLERALTDGDMPGAMDALLTKTGTARKFSDKLAGIACVREAQDVLLRLGQAQHQHEAWLHQQRMARLARGLLEDYAALKRERGWIDMGDLERAALALMSDPVLSGWVQERLDARVRHVLIDEFQDTNPLQWQALSAWLSGYAGAGQAPGVFIVGDPKQSIYRFRRAEPQVFMAAKEFVVQGLGGDVLSCDHTRRNAQGITALVNTAMGAARDAGAYDGFREHSTDSTLAGQVLKLPRLLRATADAGLADPASGGVAPASLWRDSLTTPRHTAEDTLRTLECRQAAQWVAALLADPASGHAAKDIMVLARRRQRLGLMQAELARLHVPAQQPEKADLADMPEVQDLVALLDVLVSNAHDLSLARALKSPLFAASDDDLVQLVLRKRAMEQANEKAGGAVSWWQVLQDGQGIAPALQAAGLTLARWKQWLSVMPPHDALSAIYDDADVLRRFAAATPATLRPGVLANLRALLHAAMSVNGGRYTTAYALVRALLAGGMAAPVSPDDKGVRLLTVHGAKGLEAPVVLLLDTDGESPKAETMGVLVDWPGEDAYPRRFAFLASESRPPACAAHALQAEQQARRREELNGLYVAITRTRQTLVLSSVEPHGKTAGSWWERLEAHAAAAIVPSEVAAVPGAEATEGSFSLKILQKLPLAPVQYAQAAIETIANPDSAEARIGQAMHRLLEWVVPEDGGVRQAPWTVQHFAQVRADFGLDVGQLQGATAMALAILQGDGAWAWDSRQLLWHANEVPLTQRGRLLRIDRLVHRAGTVEPAAWWVLDYKSTAQPQNQPDLVAQLTGYRNAIVKAQPGQPVRAAFLTAPGALIEIPFP